MEVKLIKEIAVKIGEGKLRHFDLEEDSFNYKDVAILNLRHWTIKRVRDLKAEVEKVQHIRGSKVLIKDLETWIAAVDKPGQQKARSVKMFCSLAEETILQVEGHRLYKKNDVHGEAFVCYYVNEIEFHPENRRDGYTTPAQTHMELAWEELGGRKMETIKFLSEDCVAMTVEAALARQGYYCETPAMRASYKTELKKFSEIIPLIGKQYFAIGVATDDLDGNTKRERRGWWDSRTNKIILDRDGPSRVVIDVFHEDETEEKEDRQRLNLWFWKSRADRLKRNREVDEDSTEESNHGVTPEDLDEDRPEVEIPIHPFCACFDLRRHRRLRIHVNYLTEYKYDRSIIDKLILPVNVKNLVKMLIEYKGTAFKDIVAGKSGGAIILACGAPGTGKTLTAEVFAEAEERALYSVQASQLGVEPEELEDELMKVLARARRWNAVMLLDEADVYVHKRGDDLAQNAIVGVFLRVLEYHSSILFMTTNRSKDVDDAIASRCIARIDYGYPDATDQTKIWEVLAGGSNIGLSIHTIRQIVKAHPKLSGRDVKNLLKLAQLVSNVEGKPITAETVTYVSQFKPTNSDE